MEKKENQRVMLTKRLIKESLIRLLPGESIYKISIRTLCEDAGINRSTFYKYYGSQYDVLAELEADLLGGIQKSLSEQTGGNALEEICACLDRNVEMVRLLVGNNVDPDFPEKLFQLPQIQTLLVERLGDRYDSENRSYVEAFLIYGCYHLACAWITRDQREPPRALAALMQTLTDQICRA